MSERALALRLLCIPAAYAAAAFVPGGGLWGVDALRYLGPPAWASAAVGVFATLLLLWGRRPSRAGSGVGLPPVGVVAVLAALVVLLLPDRTLFVGDSLLRLRAVETGGSPESFFPQAVSLDSFLHWRLPRFLWERWALPPALWHRLLGAAEAAALAGLAGAFARAASLRGGAAVTGFALVFFGGWLTLFTGLGKGFTELVLCTAAVGALGLHVVRSGHQRVLLGLVVSIALLVHRSALALLPCVAWVLWRSRRRPEGGARSPVEHLAWIAPALALASQAPALGTAFQSLDTANFGLAGGAGRNAFYHPLHLLDVAQVLLFLVPGVVLFKFPGKAQRHGAVLRSERNFLWVLALPFLLLTVLYLPPQGLFRDFDGVAAAGVALALVLAHHVGSRFEPGRTPAAWAVFLWCALPVVWWLALYAQPRLAMRRVEAILAGPPERERLVRAHAWDFLGSRRFDAGDYAGSAAALERAARDAPSPRLLAAWSESARRAGDWEQARRAYEELLSRAPDEPRFQVLAHLGLAAAAGRRSEFAVAREHLEAVLAIEPGNPDALRLLEQVQAESGRVGEEETTP